MPWKVKAAVYSKAAFFACDVWPCLQRPCIFDLPQAENCDGQPLLVWQAELASCGAPQGRGAATGSTGCRSVPAQSYESGAASASSPAEVFCGWCPPQASRRDRALPQAAGPKFAKTNRNFHSTRAGRKLILRCRPELSPLAAVFAPPAIIRKLAPDSREVDTAGAGSGLRFFP